MSNTTNKRVLITGGFGFIGSNLAIYLQEQGYDVAVLDNMDPNSGANEFNLEHETGITKYHGDIINEFTLADNIPNYDVIVNCAASTSHSGSMKAPFANIDTNVIGVLNLLDAIRLYNPKAKFIQLGTTSQYGRHEVATALVETDFEAPLDIYSANKSVAEKFCRIYGQFYGLNTTCLRLSNVFGERAAIHTPQLSFHSYFIGLAVQAKPLTIYGDGGQIRDFVSVTDVVWAIGLCIENDEKTRNQVYNVVSSDPKTVLDFAQNLAIITGSQLHQVEWPKNGLKTEIGDCIYNNAKLMTDTGWLPCALIDYMSSLENTINFYKKHLKEYIRC